MMLVDRNRGFLRIAAFIVRDDLLIFDFLIVEKVKYLCCCLVSLKHNNRLALSLFVINRDDLIIIDHIVDFENDEFVHFPGDIAQHDYFCGM
jgi:hypothetical protein